MQTIDEEAGQELLLRLLRVFGEKTGTPVLCNTSLNDKGEPIINRIAEAVNFALRKGIKVAYFNGKRVRLKNHEKYEETSPLKRPLRMAVWQSSEEREKLVEVFNPYRADMLTVIYYIYAKLENLALLGSEDEVKKLKVRSKIFAAALSPFLKTIINKMCSKKFKGEENKWVYGLKT